MAIATSEAPARSPTAATLPAAQGAVRDSLDVLGRLYNYPHWIYTCVRPYLGGRVCEVGAGTGNLTQFLLRHASVTAIDPDARCCEIGRGRFRDHANVRFVNRAIQECPGGAIAVRSFDSVVSSNVLEHIEDDVDALRRMFAICRPAGRVVVVVPAFQGLFGELDRAFGHYRRYTKRSLAAAFRLAGLVVESARYVNIVGAVGWWWCSRVRRQRQLNVRQGDFFDRLVPVLAGVETALPTPFGQSLCMVGRRFS